ncbi:bifunctional adenosylcobinamide kinase/adenosylcobinamide-phosphate guanylyltransferase [Undibacterium griseum]|uniref:Bifunctional adenosylcobalamin biosynthesis protein n=1 Tax=Undibacterium griseum TaxID=2762295 RepID=A0ABR6YRQ9_9BURK|nr:bifunctional adenosylcobinamide kinase/adenosylcobinamide-phosphate guanylyltransferase [Undibacterium griseum]MBC3886589.1 bifunctional adenosylcobinamide kinase/adenosylcobinamide-phosphate guanylyltransferase [Undibacterium griseum]
MSSTLIFGGARSGKSAFAEQLATQWMTQPARAGSAPGHGRQVIYLATAQAADAEMQQRITHHQQRRPAEWRTLEQPLALADTIRRHSQPDTLILIDCITVWLSNCLFADNRDFPEIGTITPPAIYTEQRAALLDALAQAPGEVILVSNEVGMGIVPMGAVSRWFTDEAGWLNQALASCSERVIWVAAGLPLYLKNAPQPWLAGGAC